ncbi:hypothetical protein J6590_076914 [Homalodisca vitripennis]|nr:hypothetical protein J6590_076914 [Homalodisca vitripennis]
MHVTRILPISCRLRMYTTDSWRCMYINTDLLANYTNKNTRSKLMSKKGYSTPTSLEMYGLAIWLLELLLFGEQFFVLRVDFIGCTTQRRGELACHNLQYSPGAHLLGQ